MGGLAGPGDAPLLQQGNDGIGDDIAVQPQIPSIGQVLQGFVCDIAQAHLQGGAVIDDAGDVACNALHVFFLRRNAVQFGNRVVYWHQVVNSADVHGGVAHGAGHVGVDFGNYQPCGGQRRRNDVHRDAQTDVTECIGQGHLDQGHVHRNSSACHQFRNTGNRHWNVLDASLSYCMAHVHADKEGAVSEPGVAFAKCVSIECLDGNEMQQLQISRGDLHGFELPHQCAGRRTAGAQKHMVTVADVRHRELRCRHLVGEGFKRSVGV